MCIQGARQLRILQRGGNLDMAWATRPKLDPIQHVAAPLVRHAKEWWLSVDAANSNADELNPKQLRAM